MATFCVEGICVESERFPTREQIEEAREEARRARLTEQTRLALTVPRNVGPFARLTPYRPGG